MNFFFLTLLALLVLGVSGSTKGRLQELYKTTGQTGGSGDASGSRPPTSSPPGLRAEGYVCAFTWDPKDIEAVRYVQLNVILPGETVKVSMILASSGRQEVDLGGVHLGSTISATITTQEDWARTPSREILVSPEQLLKSKSCQVKLLKP